MSKRAVSSSIVNGTCARVAGDDVVERSFDGIGERGRQALRDRPPERVAQAGGVLGRGPSPGDLDDPPFGAQLVEPGLRIARAAGGDLIGGERPEIREEVVEVVGVARVAGRNQSLQFQLELGERFGVEQLAQLLRAHEVAQEIAVERERGGPALGEGRVALVHVGRDPAEQQGLRERRGAAGLDRHDAHLARADLGEHLAQRGHVEDVAQALTRRLQQHRERREAARDLEQVGRALPLLPQRRALAGTAPRQQQRPRRVLAELRREQRRVRQPGDEELVDLVGIGEQQLGRDVVDRLRQPQDDAVVAPEHLHRQVGAREPLLDRERPRRVHTRAEGREDADAPIADLVGEALDDDGAVVGDRARRLGLLVEIHPEVRRGPGVEAVFPQHRFCLCAPQAAQLAHEPAQRAAELERPAGPVALPERRLRGLAGRGSDDHAVDGDLLDAPGRRAEHEALADAALVDHLLVELADPAAVGQEHAEQPAVGDRAAALHRDPLRAFARPDATFDAVPDDARPQPAEAIGGIPSREHVERLAERVLGQLREVRAPADERVQVVDAPLVDRARRDDLLREHVERVARVTHLLDQALAHAPHHDRGLEQIAAVLREDLAGARLADLVAGATDALYSACDRTGRLDQHDQIDRAHVDAELEARRGDDAAQPTLFELGLDLHPLLARQRSVVRAHELLARELVEARGEPLRETPGVAEDDRGAVRADQLEDARVHVRPDAVIRLWIVEPERAGSGARGGGVRARLVHVVDRDDHLDVEGLAGTGVDDRDRARPVLAVAAQEAGDLVERPLRGRQADALRRRVGDRLEPLEREHEVGAALGRRERVDLVDDHGLHAAQRFARLRGEHQVERLGRRDEDVGRVADELLTLLGGGVARTHGHGRRVE